MMAMAWGLMGLGGRSEMRSCCWLSFSRMTCRIKSIQEMELEKSA